MPPVHDLPRPDGVAFDLLAGTTVLDLTTSIAGPFATLLLADMGAEVIKLERPGAGDDSRHWGRPAENGRQPWYDAVNRNKRSVALDLAGAAGQALFAELVRAADIVVTNQVPRVQHKLGTDYASVSGIRADVIYVALTGFGLDGARRDWPCYDLIAEGYSSVMDLTGPADAAPQKIGTPAADMLAGMDAAFAAVAALNDRARTGKGRLIDVALVDSMTRLMAPMLVNWLATGELRRRTGATDSPVAVYRTFEAADGPFTLGMPNEGIWRRFCGAIGHPEWVDEPRYRTNADRLAVREELVGKVQAIVGAKPRAHWIAAFRAARVPCGPIYRMDETTADAGLLARGMFYRIDDDGGTAVPQVNTAIRVDGHANAPRRPPPALGADGPAVLRDVLGKSEAEIAALTAAGAI